MGEIDIVLDNTFKLNQMGKVLNKQLFQGKLPKFRFVLSNANYREQGLLDRKVWPDEYGGFYLIYISCAVLSRPAQEIGMVVAHQLLHLYCAANNIQDTSCAGIYHTRMFAEAAENHGLRVRFNPSNGFGNVRPSAEVMELCASYMSDEALQ